MTQTRTIVNPGQGPKYWLVGDQMTFKITGDRTGGAFALAENYIDPQHGPPPHVHHREDECFYVLEGQFLFASGEGAMIAGPGTAVFLPRDVPHAFKNVGDTPGRFLLLTTPAGFERMVVAAGESIPAVPHKKEVGPADVERLIATAGQYGIELVNDWQPPPPTSAVAGDIKLWVLGLHVTIKLASRDTAGRLSLAEVAAQPGQGVPAHSHREMDELFYVLDGTWEFRIAGEVTRATPGTFVHVPPGVTHAFENVGSGPGRLLDYHVPGGFERFFEEAGVEAAEDTPPPPLPPPDRAKLVELFDKHGMDVPHA